MNNIKKLEEEIKFLKSDIRLIQIKLDDLSFEFEDLKNEMVKRNLSKFYTTILSFALIKLI
ncbi:hypothetical protein LCGC14_1657710 [marine sediment metagenome]|uniref:Uncharacterized protein n=1 Tax=marine sediment metagenome TaxID=412755 RepID=A0A0F9KV71_9ZZZZ